MARTNIFQRLAERDNIEDDVYRIDTLFNETETLMYHSTDYTIVKFVDEYCFPYWKNRRHCLDVDDYLDTIGYAELRWSAKKSIEDFISFAEII